MNFLKITTRGLPAYFLFLLLPSLAQSATIKGKILDSKSNEALIGATIYNKDNKEIHDIAGLDGSFSLKNVPPGTYTIVAEFFGYTALEKTIIVADEKQVVVQDFLMEQQTVNLGQVQVVSSYEKGSDNAARNAEKNADYVMNVISAKTIELLVDVTVGDVLQRLPGVVAEKSVTGGGRYATIRGMDKRYNYTTINGVKVPSPDFKNRYVPLDIIPSALLERLEVIKTLTPDMEGDAIGGAMNLVLKDAPDLFSLDADLAIGYDASLFNTKYQQFDASVINPNSPNEINGPTYSSKIGDFPLASMNYTPVTALPDIIAGVTVGNRFFNKKFGVLFSVNYQNSYSSTQEMFIKAQAKPNPQPFNTPDWDYISARDYSVQQQREAAHLKLDYEFNQRHKLTFYTLFAGMNQYRSNIEVDTNSSLKNSELDPAYETKVTYQQIFSSILQGQDTLARGLYLDWTGAYSRASANTPDWSKYSLLGTLGTPGYTFSSLSMKWMQVSDEDFSGYLNLTYQFKIFKQRVILKAGIMNRDKERNAFYAEYNVGATPNQPNFNTINQTLGDTNLYRFSDVTGSPDNANSYSVHEDITGYYAMAKLNLFTRFDLLGGVRIENTSEAYITQLPSNLPGQYGSSQYTNFLPGWGIKYSINDKMAVRLGYFASITRPSFFEIVPYSITGDQYDEKGNPYLLPSLANNYDLRWEFFPQPSDQILAGVFFKQIYDPIEYSVLSSSSAPSATFVQPINIGGDTGAPVINYGFEFVLNQYINKNFGISANYTYTHSSITVPSQKYEGSPGNFKTVDTTETRPMQGQADHIANLTLIYKAPKIGLQIALSAVYTGKLISDISAWYGLDLWEMPMTKIDFSFEKRLSKKLKITLYGRVSNLLNAPLIIRMFPPNPYANTPGQTAWLPNQDGNGTINSIVVQKDVYGQSFLLGIKYKF
jgi:outer membrane receptor for ferrienterochelin and colicin